MKCIECGGQTKKTGPSVWECLDCGAELHKGDDGKIFVDGYYDVDDNESEMISVWDAANIYLSNGFDEDYRFGYTHEELINALKQR